ARIQWGKNFRTARQIAGRMNINLKAGGYLDMPSGSMFWARPDALRPFIDLHLDFQDFPSEPCELDGTFAHAIERLFLFVCEKAGYSWTKVSDTTDSTTVIEIASPADIAPFLEHHGFNLLRPNGRHR